MAGFVASLPDRNRLTLLGGQEAMRWVRQSIPALMRVTDSRRLEELAHQE